MLSDIYAKPDLSTKVRYNRKQQEDGAGWEEKMVDIYETVESIRDDPTDFQSQEGGPHTQKQPPVQRRPVKAAVLSLRLLCFLMTAGIITVSICYILVTVEKDQLQTRYNNLSYNHIQLQTRYNNLSNNHIQLQTRYNNLSNNHIQLHKQLSEGKWCPEGWRQFGCSCYFISAQWDYWTESRRDCVSRGADLVIINSEEEQEFITGLNGNGDSWIGLRRTQDIGYQWKWKWVDGSPWTQAFWAKDPTSGYYASCCDGQGNLRGGQYYNNKKWICEKISCFQ